MDPLLTAHLYCQETKVRMIGPRGTRFSKKEFSVFLPLSLTVGFNWTLVK